MSPFNSHYLGQEFKAINGPEHTSCFRALIHLSDSVLIYSKLDIE